MTHESTWKQLPRIVSLGEGTISEIIPIVEELRLPRDPLVITTETPKKVAGLEILRSFEEKGHSPKMIVIKSGGMEEVERVVRELKKDDFGFVIGVGGGKPIDITKIASVELHKEFISVPTAASHDGIASSRASIHDGEIQHSITAKPPIAIVADTKIIASSPWKLTSSGCADIISNFTAVKDWRLAKLQGKAEYSEYAAALSEMTAEMLIQNVDLVLKKSEKSVFMVLKALVSSGVAMSIAGSSHPASGGEHLFSHQLNRVEPGERLHGHQVGVGTILTEYLHSGDSGKWRKIKNTLEKLECPTTAEGLGVTRESIIEALSTAHEIRDRCTILGDGIGEMKAEMVAEKTGVI